MSATTISPKSIDLPDRHFTLEEYLRLEQEADHKSEYLNGRVYVMPGADESHVTIASNLIIDIGADFRARRRGCRIFGSDMRVMVEATNLLTYPNISVACRDIRYVVNMRPSTLLNPILLVEILSESTQRYDRRRKFDPYRQIPSLREYALIAQTKHQVKVYSREGNSADAWILRIFTEKDEVLPLSSLNVTLAMSDIYDGVTFPADSASIDENDALPA